MTRQEAERIADKASCDARSVLAYAAGAEVRSKVAERIEHAAKVLKITLPKRPKSP